MKSLAIQHSNAQPRLKTESMQKVFEKKTSLEWSPLEKEKIEAVPVQEKLENRKTSLPIAFLAF